MIGNRDTLQKRFILMAVASLATGLGAAVIIYLTAGNGVSNALVEEFANSKTFRHELEVYGGKANVLADDFARWFTGLWQGQTLAYTVAGIGVIAFLIFLFLAWFTSGNHRSDGEGRTG